MLRPECILDLPGIIFKCSVPMDVEAGTCSLSLPNIVLHLQA